MQSWSYRFETFDADDEETGIARLNQFGSQGWECFHVEVYARGLTRKSFHFWLKRAGRLVDPSTAEIV